MKYTQSDIAATTELECDRISQALYDCHMRTHDYMLTVEMQAEQELQSLHSSRDSIMAERRAAAAQGDLSENSEYHDATKRLTKVNQDIALAMERATAVKHYNAYKDYRQGISLPSSDNTPRVVADNSSDSFYAYGFPKEPEGVDAEQYARHIADGLMCEIGRTVYIEVQDGNLRTGYTWTICPPECADNEHELMSHKSPVGNSIIGAKAGHTFSLVIKGKNLVFTLKGVL